MNAVTTESAGAMRRATRTRALVYWRSRPLGLCWIAYGILRLAMAVALAIWSGTATVMFGALLTRVPDPFSLMTAFHVIYVVFLLFSAFIGVVGIVAGVALTSGAESSQRLALFAAILAVSQIPVGTTLGAYTLVALLPRASRPTTADPAYT